MTAWQTVLGRDLGTNGRIALELGSRIRFGFGWALLLAAAVAAGMGYLLAQASGATGWEGWSGRVLGIDIRRFDPVVGRSLIIIVVGGILIAGALLLAWLSLPNSYFIRLDDDGFEIGHPFSHRRYAWGEVESFGLYREVSEDGRNARSRGHRIGFLAYEGAGRSQTGRSISERREPRRRMIWNLTTLDNRQLAELMNEARAIALARRPAPAHAVELRAVRILRPSRAVLVRLTMVVSAIFAVPAILFSNSPLALILFGVPGLLVLICVAALFFPGATYVSLDRAGFTTAVAWSKRRYQWSEVERFGPVWHEGYEAGGLFHFSSVAIEGEWRRSVPRQFGLNQLSITWRDHAILNLYGMPD